MKRFVFVGPLGVLLLWLLVSHTGLVDSLLLPTPENVGVKLVHLVGTGDVLRDFSWTVLRWSSGWFVGVIIGVPLGLLMGISPRVYASLEIVVDFFRSIPVMAMFPLFLVFLGIGDLSKIAISVWTTMLYVLINTLYGVRHTSEARRRVARVFRASRWQTFAGVVFPEALPHIFVGMRISVSMSLVLVVAAEMVMGTTAGLGKRIFEAGLTFAVSEMYATIILTGLMGYLSNRIFVALERRVVHWASR
jgi:NitT/TauT family transport system permease protein